ncbi:MAG: sugar ABC transporter ATP-binding protein [Actinobacteria bacterium]|nr:sugar ABC transporter ATP-binding protein [Actinomycetota bacterium]
MGLLKVENISISFPGILALNKVNFELNENEIHCLVGHNGAGKSTLVKLLSGVHSSDELKDPEGRIYIKGKLTKLTSPIEARELGIATIHQGRDLVPDLNGYENIFLGIEEVGKAAFLKRKSMLNKSLDMLYQKMKIKNKINLNLPIKYLSTTDQEIIAITKALIKNCDILLVDEASAALDIREKLAFFEILKELRNKGMGIVYISHFLEEVFEIGDRVTVLRDGRVVETNKIEEVDMKKLIHLMVGEISHVTKSGRDDSRDVNTNMISPKASLLLEIKNLNKDILRNINLKINKGEIIGLTGLAGCGMVDLCETIFGINNQINCKIFIDGREVKIKNPSNAIKNGLGLIANDRHVKGLVMIRPLSENISYVLLNQNKSLFKNYQFFINSIGQNIISSLNIRAYSEKQCVDTLSGGNQQKVVVGRWFSYEHKLKVLMCVQPTEGVDVKTREDIHNFIYEMSKKGKGVILASDDLDEILALSDRIIVMNEGKIIAELKNKKITKKILLEKILMGESINKI